MAREIVVRKKTGRPPDESLKFRGYTPYEIIMAFQAVGLPVSIRTAYRWCKGDTTPQGIHATLVDELLPHCEEREQKNKKSNE